MDGVLHLEIVQGELATRDRRMCNKMGGQDGGKSLAGNLWSHHFICSLLLSSPPPPHLGSCLESMAQRRERNRKGSIKVGLKINHKNGQTESEQ